MSPPEPTPSYVRVPFRNRMAAGPLDRAGRVQAAIATSPAYVPVQRLLLALRPTSRIRRAAIPLAAAYAMKVVLAGDRRAMRSLYAPDAEIVVPPWPGLQERYVGGAGFLDFFEAWTEQWEHVELEQEELIDRGDALAVFGWMHAGGKTSGVQTKQTYAAVMHYRGRWIVRGEWFLTWEEGLRAIGVRPAREPRG